MNIKTYNPNVRVKYVSWDSDGFSLDMTLEQLVAAFAALAGIRDEVALTLRADGTYYYPLHVRVGGSTGTVVVSLI